MSGVSPNSVTIAPRGKAFKVFAWTEVAGKRLAIMLPGHFATRQDAEAEAQRQQVPGNVMLVDLTVQVDRS